MSLYVVVKKMWEVGGKKEWSENLILSFLFSVCC